MKNKVIATFAVTTLAVSMLSGCGKKEETPQEPAPAVEEASVQEASVEATTEAPAEASTEEEPEEVEITSSLDETIGQGIILCNNNLFKAGEAVGEGHILMGADDGENEGEQKCFVLEMYGAYEFQDGNFVKCAGTGVIPCVVTVKPNEDGTFEFISLVEAEDGGSFVDSIKRDFPEALWSRCITIDDDDRNELEKQERSYAEEYLSTIGREDVEIGDYSDFEHPMLTDLGVSDDVANKMFDVRSGDGFEFFCPNWVGEREVLDENVRYTYKMEYDEKKKQIIFSKVLYETGEVLESSVYDAKTGDKVE
jgi:bla regulator protein BlaR1